MQCGALNVAVSVAVDLRSRAIGGNEGVVFRHPAVRVNAHHAAEVRGQPLGLVALAAIAEGDVEVTGGGQDEARAEVVTARHFRLRDEQGREVLEVHTAQASATHLGAVQTLCCNDITEIDPRRAAEVFGDGHIQQPSLTHFGDSGQAADFNEMPTSRQSHQRQASWFLGDQRAPVGKEGHAPGLIEILAQDDGGDDRLAISGMRR